MVLSQIPSLPIHLASLSQLLQTRLQLHQPLLSLSGRLDLALAQITMRKLALEASNAHKVNGHGDGKVNGENEGERYVEGESDDESVVVEEGDGDGEVEDVDMRVGSEE